MKKLYLILLFIPLLAYAANTPPPGNNGDIIDNVSGKYGNVPLVPNSLLGEVTTASPVKIVPRNNLTFVTTGGTTFLDATITSGPFSSALGSATTANPYITGDFSSGFFTPGAAQIAVEASSTEAMLWTSTGTIIPSISSNALVGTLTGGLLYNIGVGSGLSLTGTTLSVSGGSSTPTGPAGGDLGGTYPNPTVTSVSHVSSGILGVANGGTAGSSLTANGVLYGNGTSAIQATSTAANSALITSSTGVPLESQTLPSAVQLNITQLGTITTGTIPAITLPIATTTTLGVTFPVANGGLSITTTGGETVTDISVVTTGIHDSAQFTVGQNSSALYENSSGGVGGLNYATVRGTTNYIIPFFTAANLLYQVTNGMDIDPRYYGASCNGTALNLNNGGTGSISVTQNSTTIGASGYTFQAGVATAQGGGDVGRRISLTGSTDCGPTTYIASVTTSNNTATLGVAPVCASGNYAAIIGGYPQSACGTGSSTPSQATDDTCSIHNASVFSAISHGGKVKLPPYCVVHNLTLQPGTLLEGNDGGVGYGSVGTSGLRVTPLYVGSTMYSSDSALGIQVDTSSSYDIRLKDFTLLCGNFPFLGFPGLSGAGIGNEAIGILATEGVSIDHLTISGCPIGVGSPFGWNQPITFTVAPTTNNQLTVLSITSTSLNQYGYFGGGGPSDFLAIGRSISGTGVPGGTTLTVVPAGGTTGLYTTSTALNITSTETLTSSAQGQVLIGKQRFTQFYNNGIDLNGDLSDFSDIGSVYTGGYYKCMWAGPSSSGFGNSANWFIGDRFEECNNGALVLDGAFQYQFTGTQWQANDGYAIETKNTGGDNLITGGMIQGNGTNVDGNARLGAQIALSGSGGGFAIVGTTFIKQSFGGDGSGHNSAYLLGTETGFSGDYVSLTEGDLTDGYNTAPTNFAAVTPTHYKQVAPGIPYIDTTQTVLNISSSGQVGMGEAANTGVALDLFANTTTANSSIGLPKGSTTNRPSTPIAGMFRYNTTLNTFEGFNGTAWGAVGGTTVIPFSFGGLTLSNDGGSPNTVFDIAAGGAASDDLTTQMEIASAITKTTSSFVAGSGNGSLDTGTVAANSWYTDYLIENTGTAATDVLLSLSTTNPSLPSGYGVKRRIGALETTTSGNIIAFTQDGAVYYWATPTLDVTTTGLGTSAALETLNVPPGVKVTPLCEVSIANSLASTTTPITVYLTSPDETDLATTATSPFTGVPGYSYLAVTTTGAPTNAACPFLTTNTSQQIRARSNAAGTSLSIITRGWID